MGAGAFGFAIAKLISDKNPEMPIGLYDPVKSFVETIQDSGCHPIFHKGVKLPKTVHATMVVEEAIKDAQLIILAVPGQYLRGCIRSFIPFIEQDVIMLNVAKALEKKTNKPLSVVADEELIMLKHKYYFSALAGGMIATEVTKMYPVSADIACKSLNVASYLCTLFSSSTFKVVPTDDLVGVELAGALKNRDSDWIWILRWSRVQ